MYYSLLILSEKIKIKNKENKWNIDITLRFILGKMWDVIVNWINFGITGIKNIIRRCFSIIIIFIINILYLINALWMEWYSWYKTAKYISID